MTQVISPRYQHAQGTTRSARGFTLIELMVALTGSLFFTVFVFMLSRDVSRFFTGQTRTSMTTVSALTGFERLRADIARAGFLSSPNIARDANRCPHPTAGALAVAPQQIGVQFNAYPGMQQMAVLGITSSPAAVTSHDFYATLNHAKLNPDVLTLYGNYSSSEQFPVRGVDFTANPVTITLEQNSPALVRVGINAATPDDEATATLSRIFRRGSMLRVVDENSREQYAIVDGVDVDANLATLTLSSSIALVQKGSGTNCGLHAHSAGLAVNPVNIIRYAVTNVRGTVDTDHPHLKHLFDGTALPYEDTRFDLMRYEVPPTIGSGTTLVGVTWPDGTSVTASGELVAEYAVDLKFGLTVLSDYQTGALTTLAETANRANYVDPPVSATAGGIVAATSTRGPHFIRGVDARLSVRYRDADREVSILADPSASGVTPDQLIRVRVAASPDLLARTRAFRGQIAIRNTRNVLWN